MNGGDRTQPESTRVHNIRNHLSVILGYCDLLLAEVPPSERKHADITEMRHAAAAALALLDDLREQP